MSKVYLLLRNNKQSGPHSLEELLKLGVKPLDLIWVEGKSFGWSYPSEINALKPYVAKSADDKQEQPLPGNKYDNREPSPVNNQAYMPVESEVPAPVDNTAGKPKVYVSMPVNRNRPVEQIIENKKEAAEDLPANPADKIEQKAEELRRRMQSYVPEQKAIAKTEEPVVTTKYSSTVPEREEAYTSWIYDKKANKSNLVHEVQKKWGSIAIAILLILVVGYGISQFNNDDKKEVEVASTQIADANKTVPQPLITEPETPSTQPLTDNVPNNDPQPINTRSSDAPVKVVRNNQVAAEKKIVPAIHKVTLIRESKKVVVVKPVQKEVVTKTISKPVDETKIAEPGTVITKKEPAPVEVNTKKKKTLNEKVDAFFNKFSRKIVDPTVIEASQPPVTTTNTGTVPATAERKAVHRDDKPVADKPVVTASPAVITNLAEYVEVSTNKPSENWMLGVHGLKVSLHNTSKETVKTAEVELRYYTEQNEVLEKKIVNFNNIPPGKTVTLSAPDHRLADHTDFRLVTAK